MVTLSLNFVNLDCSCWVRVAVCLLGKRKKFFRNTFQPLLKLGQSSCLNIKVLNGFSSAEIGSVGFLSAASSLPKIESVKMST